MKVKILKECGYEEAMIGLSLSYNKSVEEMPRVAEANYQKGDEESKFLRHIDVWMLVEAPRYWWIQMAEYRIGQHWLDDWEWQSGSTMHTIMKRELEQTDFEIGIPQDFLDRLNGLIWGKEFYRVKNALPEGFLQSRVVKTNYQAIRRIIKQRRKHRLPQWQFFIRAILEQIGHKEFFSDLIKEDLT